MNIILEISGTEVRIPVKAESPLAYMAFMRMARPHIRHLNRLLNSIGVPGDTLVLKEGQQHFAAASSAEKWMKKPGKAKK